MVVSLALLAVASGGGVALLVATPRLTAVFISRVSRHLLADEELKRDARKAFAELCADAEEEFAAVLWSPAMQKGLEDAIVELFRRPDYHDAVALLAKKLAGDQTLQDTIREGVLEAFQDESLKAEVKAVVIEGLHDEELRSELLRAAISTVKTGIREAVEDTELKEVITVAIRDALEDPRLSGVLRGALKEALADQELHKATIQGAVNALNPFKGGLSRLGLGADAATVDGGPPSARGGGSNNSLSPEPLPPDSPPRVYMTQADSSNSFWSRPRARASSTGRLADAAGTV